jgi:hypothetical protein
MLLGYICMKGKIVAIARILNCTFKQIDVLLIVQQNVCPNIRFAYNELEKESDYFPIRKANLFYFTQLTNRIGADSFRSILFSSNTGEVKTLSI